MRRFSHPSGLDLGPRDAFRLWSEAARDVISYPPGWLERAGAAEIAALGFTAYEDTPPPLAPVDPLTLPLTRRQLRLGLLNLGATWEAVRAFAAALPDPVAAEAALIAIEDGEEYNRRHELFTSIPAAFGLTPEAIDAEWARAVHY
ncbi:hypothetical protein R5H32_15955 [Defluviimonas sp. D31]|uniref:hypothetical protein n=1 Tax=Defluviimonas sp. D31 TaxID=3083253 RepID=UPI00296F94DB|nr:hypothetical protein [Defluviimonas sp. D31]MDW4550856.1 hypothetical protein [Defluviimonas sp. D31]